MGEARKSSMKTTTLILIMLLSGVVSAQQKPTTGYAPVNGLKMYYEIHGSGEPVVLLHGAFMAITDDWRVWINELAKTRKVIAVEMQGHGRTADINRDITLRKPLRRCGRAARLSQDPERGHHRLQLGRRRRDAVCDPPSGKSAKGRQHFAAIRRDGWVKEANDFWPNFTWEMFKGTPCEAEYKKLNPNPDGFPNFFNHIKATALRPYDFGADKFKATKAPMFFIHGDADGVRLDHIAEMYRLKGGEISTATCSRTRNRDWLFCPTQHTSR